MRAWIGKSILLIAMIHTIFGLIVFRVTVAELIGEGLFNTVNGQLDREFAFWLIANGLWWFPLGWLIDHIERNRLNLPQFLGFLILLITAISIFIMPVSGFWLALIPSFGMIFREMLPGRGLNGKRL